MAKSVTVNFDDGSSHTYDNVPDDVSDDQVTQRAGSEFSDKTITGVGGGAPTSEIPSEGAVAPTELSLPEKIVGAGATAMNLAVEHPGIAAGAAGLYKANKAANAYIAGKEAETAALQARSEAAAKSAAGHQQIQQQKINMKAGLSPSGPVQPQQSPILNSQGQPMQRPTVAAPVTPQAPQQMPTPAAPAAAEGGVMNQARNIVQKLALDKVLKGAGIAAGAYEMGKGLFGTSPEEIEIMRQAEARKRAQGWKPLNER